MAKGDIDAIIGRMSPSEKKEALNSLVIGLLKSLNETEKEEMLRTVVAGRKEGRRTAALVDE